jgi:hypothetical protein
MKIFPKRSILLAPPPSPPASLMHPLLTDTVAVEMKANLNAHVKSDLYHKRRQSHGR